MNIRQEILSYLESHSTARPVLIARATGLEPNSVGNVAREMAREGILVVVRREWRSLTYRLATAQERGERANGINTIFDECRNSDAMQRVLSVYGRVQV